MHSPAVHRGLEQIEQAFHDLNSRGGIEGNDDQGGTRVASPTARCFHPSKTLIPHNSPFRWRKGKTSTSCPTRGPQDTNSLPIPQEGQTNKASFTKTQLQGEIVGNDGQGGLGWPVPTARCFHPSTRPIPDNFPFQQSKRKMSTSCIQTERESPPALAPSTNDTPRPNNILLPISTPTGREPAACLPLKKPRPTTNGHPAMGCKQQHSDAEAKKSPGKNQHWTNRGSQLQRSTPKEKRVQGLLPKSNQRQPENHIHWTPPPLAHKPKKRATPTRKHIRW